MSICKPAGNRTVLKIICGKRTPSQEQRTLADGLMAYLHNAKTFQEGLQKGYGPSDGQSGKNPSNPVEKATGILDREAAKQTAAYSFPMASADYSLLTQTPRPILEEAWVNSVSYSQKNEKWISRLTRIAPTMLLGTASSALGFAVAWAIYPQGTNPYLAGFIGALASIGLYTTAAVAAIKSASKKSLQAISISMPLENILITQKAT